MEPWKDFFVAEVGAAAALAGLLFVGVSINLTRVLSIPAIANRALESLFMLFAVLIVSLLALVPGQPMRVFGAELLATWLVIWGCVSLADIHSVRHTRKAVMHHVYASIGIDQFTLLFYLGAAVAVMGKGESGVYWLVPATILSFIKAFLDAWVILVEINR